MKAAIFDMDGTLMDSMFMWDDLGRRYLETKGKEADPDLNRQVVYMTMLEGAGYMKKTYGLDEDPETIVKEIYQLIEGFYKEEVKPRPGVPELLADLKASGVSMCVASATDSYLVEYALEHTGLRHYFDRIYCCREAGFSKETDTIYQMAREFMGTEVADTWIFEDALYAAKTAVKAGFPLLGIADPSEPEQEELEKISTLYLKEFTEWPGVKNLK